MEEIINTKRGQYGRINVTLPLTIKLALMDFQKRSGYKKAEFMRLALVTGYITMAHNLEKNKKNFGNEISQQPARKD